MDYSKQNPFPRRPSAEKVARGLGWFSIGLGLAEVLMPRAMARTLGIAGGEAVVRACGLREIGTGIGLLLARNPKPWVWGRVAGDALDLALLAPQLRDGHPQRAAAAAAFAAVAGVTALDAGCARALQRQEERRRQPVFDYSDRSGLPQEPDAMRGAAAKDFETPRDMRGPQALQPYQLH